jgi:formate/nitrite transporter FocA (FNT family)
MSLSYLGQAKTSEVLRLRKSLFNFLKMSAGNIAGSNCFSLAILAFPGGTR